MYEKETGMIQKKGCICDPELIKDALLKDWSRDSYLLINEHVYARSWVEYVGMLTSSYVISVH